jgi:hypothetical protein
MISFAARAEPIVQQQCAGNSTAWRSKPLKIATAAAGMHAGLAAEGRTHAAVWLAAAIQLPQRQQLQSALGEMPAIWSPLLT